MYVLLLTRRVSYIVYLHAKICTLCSTASLVVVIRQKAQGRFQTQLPTKTALPSAHIFRTSNTVYYFRTLDSLALVSLPPHNFVRLTYCYSGVCNIWKYAIGLSYNCTLSVPNVLSISQELQNWQSGHSDRTVISSRTESELNITWYRHVTKSVL